MSSSNPFRGTNVCHRLELPTSRRPRRSIRRGRIARTPSQGGTAVRDSIPEPPPETKPASAPAPQTDRDISLLQRRLEKLSALLELQEGELKRVAGQLSEDPGLPSVYEGVQGLDEQDPEADRKRDMMARIFAANVDMRRRLDS